MNDNELQKRIDKCFEELGAYAFYSFPRLSNILNTDANCAKIINGYIVERDALRDLVKRMAAETTIARARAIAAELDNIPHYPTAKEFEDYRNEASRKRLAKWNAELRAAEEAEERARKVARAKAELAAIEARERHIAELKAIIATGGHGMKPVEAIPVTVERDPNALPPPVVLTPEQAAAKHESDNAALIANAGFNSTEGMPV